VVHDGHVHGSAIIRNEQAKACSTGKAVKTRHCPATVSDMLYGPLSLRKWEDTESAKS
jgi:hypothetical protein